MYLPRGQRRTRRLVDWPLPTLIASRALRHSRALRGFVRDRSIPKPKLATRWPANVHFRSRSALQTSGDPDLERGKIRNVALAAAALHGRVLTGGEIFSFWRTVGRPAAARGFALGAEVRGGCIVPTVGGGLCRISNLLFEAAAILGWTIVERHGHTMTSDPNRRQADATLAWPDVDLKLVPPDEVVLDVRVKASELLFEIRSSAPAPSPWTLDFTSPDSPNEEPSSVMRTEITRRSPSGVRELLGLDRKRLALSPTKAANCFSCGETRCFGRPRGLSIGGRR